jgi:SAM-dependent methyltransferase
VVGCGRGHEARLLAERGADVVAIDFAPAAIAEARRLTAPALLRAEGSPGRAGTIDFRVRDLFRLADEPERYQLVVEHCCFCALEPARRAAYVDVMARVLEPDGELVGLFYAHGRAGGPPYSVSAAELEALFAPAFEQVFLTVPTNSVGHRGGEELLGVYRRRAT